MAGASLIFSTYVGNQTAFASALVLAPDGNAILAGGGMLYRVKGNGSALLTTGSLPGVIWSLAVDGTGSIYAGGQAYNRVPPFPTTAGAFQTRVVSVPSLPGTMGNIGDGDGFVTKLDSQFNILASTLLGGEAPDETVALAIAANGNIIAGGSTYSKAFPSRGAAQGSFSPGTGFVSELTPDLSSLIFSTYAGDTRMFVVTAIVPTADGGLLFAGATQSPPYYSGGYFFSPPSSPGGVFPSDGIQGFVVKAGVEAAAPRIDRTVNAASQLGVPLSPGAVFQVEGDGFGDDATPVVDWQRAPLAIPNPDCTDRYAARGFHRARRGHAHRRVRRQPLPSVSGARSHRRAWCLLGGWDRPGAGLYSEPGRHAQLARQSGEGRLAHYQSVPPV